MRTSSSDFLNPKSKACNGDNGGDEEEGSVSTENVGIKRVVVVDDEEVSYN